VRMLSCYDLSGLSIRSLDIWISIIPYPSSLSLQGLLMKAHRPQRVGEQIKRELAELFRQLKSELGGYLLTVTEVRCSRDLRSAEVWVSVFSDQENRLAAIKRLSEKSGRIRHLLSNMIYLRRVPELIFRLDQTLDTAEKIDTLLKESGIQENDEF